MYNICKFEYDCRFIRAGQLYRLMYGKKYQVVKSTINVMWKFKQNQIKQYCGLILLLIILHYLNLQLKRKLMVI